MARRMLAWSLVLALPGCAQASPEPASPPVAAAPSFEARLAADPIWRPSDAEPVPRETARFGRYPHVDHDGDGRTDIEVYVTIRNRCHEAIQFAVGYDLAAPPDDAPLNEVAPREAVAMWIGSHERLYRRTRGGNFEPGISAGSHVVFLDGDRCSRVHAE